MNVTVWNSSQKKKKKKKKICFTKSVFNKPYLSFHLKIVEVNESRYIATFEVGGSTKKLVFA